jgi:hypothetical protein
MRASWRGAVCAHCAREAANFITGFDQGEAQNEKNTPGS